MSFLAGLMDMEDCPFCKGMMSSYENQKYGMCKKCHNKILLKGDKRG